MELKDRFLKYVSFDTQSDESSETFPSTAKQRVLLDYLAEEMKALGLTEVTVDKYGYAMGTIPATPGCEKAPVIGFIAHVDTAPDMSGADVKPHVIENYDGKDIRLNAGVTMKVADFPELSFFKGTYADPHGRHDAAGRRRQGGRGGDHDRCGISARTSGAPAR